MSTWVLTIGTICGLIALIAAATLICLAQSEGRWQKRPRWLLPGLSIIVCSGMILYGGSLLGSLYLQMTRLVSVMGSP